MDTRLSAVLEKGQILIDFRADDVEDAVLRLLVPLLLADGFTPESAKAALDCVMTRERAGSTMTGSVALPHGRLAQLPGIVAGLGINTRGLYANGTGEPKIVLAFVSPSENAADHLRFLSGAARIFKNQNAVSAMLTLDEPHSVLAEIRKLESGA